MRLEISRSDLEFLMKVAEMGRAGRTQTEICEHFGIALGTLKARIWSLGFRLVTQQVNDIELTITGERLGDLAATGQLVVVEREAAASAGAAS